ncbi:hypothetical protein LJC17_02190 [Acholeplasma sp. OttesenSCG-928-E16]|nr:hypothetical protein [Acholeplasma sp. OttesenSCG-928-E16]
MPIIYVHAKIVDMQLKEKIEVEASQLLFYGKITMDEVIWIQIQITKRIIDLSK